MDAPAFEQLYQHIYGITGLSLSAGQKAQIAAAMQFKNISRKQYLLQAGELCRHLYFICQGALRVYAIDEKGREHTISIAEEGTWITDYESFYTSRPSSYCLKALENSVLIQCSRDKLNSLKNEIPAIRKMDTIITYNDIIATEKRVYAAISLTAEERYRQMMRHHPNYVHRFSQVIIASYLGITFETLSRIRRTMCFP